MLALQQSSLLSAVFSIPGYLVLDRNIVSLTDVQAFTELIAYPLIVKGPRQGGIVCSSWVGLVNCLHTYPWHKGGSV
jgi:hypothetical protein